MKKIPPTCPEPEVGPKYWRSLDQLADKPEVREWMEREFPAGASLAPEGETRREWMKLMSASFLLAGLGGMATGCRRPEEVLTPFAKQPEGYVHGKPEYYASAMPVRGSAIPVVVKASDGRPIKLEGNDLHPLNQVGGKGHGATDAYTQAAILNLYDPDRSFRHARGGSAVRVEVVQDHLAAVGRRFSDLGGEGLAFLLEQSSSPSRDRLQADILEKFPRAKWYVYEPVDFQAAAHAAEVAYGARLNPVFDLAQARRVISFDCDFLGGEQEAYRYIRGWAHGRKSAGQDMSRLYSVESLMTLTGGNADHRLRVRPTDVVKVAAQVAAEVLRQSGYSGQLLSLCQQLGAGAPAPEGWATECAKDLLSQPGKALAMAGYGQPLVVHVLASIINQSTRAIGNTVHLHAVEAPATHGSIEELVQSLNAGAVDTLVVIGGNPAYAAPRDLEFSTVVRRAKDIIRLGDYEDETSALATWHIGRAHFLESWGDARTADGTWVPVQPLIEPLLGGITELEVLARLVGRPNPSAREVVRKSFMERGGDDFGWQKFLHDGFVAESAWETQTPEYQTGAVVDVLTGYQSPAVGDYDVVLFRDASVDDGRFNNNGWLQELPDPITKVTWENVLLISPKTAKALGVEGSTKASGGQYRQDVVRVNIGDRQVEAPVWVQPGLADNTLGMALGYGRKHTGRVGQNCGYDAYPLFLQGSRHIASGAKAEKIFKKSLVAATQEHGLMEGRPVIREANLAQFEQKPDFAQHMDLEAHLPGYVPTKKTPDGRNPGRLQNIYEHPYDQNPSTKSEIHQWGMVVDLNTCVGCSACVIACQSENNIPIVGKDQVARGREMHWMRIDRYFSHDPALDVTGEFAAEDPQMAMQPMFCQHCEAAPCESVCPVNATVHDEEGLNVMAYNRCIGTRYCANNCPYKVRRFNFFDYNKRETDYGKGQNQHFLNLGNLYKGPAAQNRNDAPEWEIIKLVRNPDVSVRMRGVMEKCTFCVQRIEQAKIAQKVKAGNSGDVAVRDGAIKTACQESCPAGAIEFGNILDPDSAVSVAKADPRNYSVLGFLDIRPRVTYLARIRNPNPVVAAMEKRDQPDSLRDYERHRHESPFDEHGHGHGQHVAPEATDAGSHAAVVTQKGDA